jgi:type IV secretion system protein VirD4
MLRAYLCFCCIFIGFWQATQTLAELVHYDKLLGSPFVVYHGVPYYLPWMWGVWFTEMYRYIPNLFGQTFKYILISLLLTVLCLFWFNPGRGQLTSHGTARWARYNDLLKMDLISSHGVVIGHYDNFLTKLFIKVVRYLENIMKEKKSFGEMAFDEKVNRQLDYLTDQLLDLKIRLEQVSDPADKADIEAQIAKIKKLIENKPKYKPRKENPLTVYPWCLLYDMVFWLYQKWPRFYLRDNSNKHLAVVAPTRSGKGIGLIVPTLLGSWDESVIVNDIKSENWGITSGYRKRMGQTVIKFEPTAADGSSARWNPLDEIPIGTALEVSMAQNVAHVLADYEGKGKLDHWGQNAENVIMACVLHLKYAHFADPKHYPSPPNLYDVASFLKINFIEEDELDKDGNPTGRKVINPKSFNDTLTALQDFEHVPDGGIDIEEWDTKQCEYVKRHFDPDDLKELYPKAQSLDNNPNVHPIIYQTFQEINSKPANEGGSIISTANTALKEYLDPVLSMNTSISDFCIDDLMNYRKAVSLYLVTPPSDLLRLAPIFRMFFEMMVRHHAREIGTYVNGQARSKYKHKCLFLMDEFSSLGNLQSFAATLSYIAGYGMKAFLINQGLPQIYSIYGKDNQILMNCHLQIFYAPNDNETGAYAEKLLGTKTIITTSTSDSGFFTKKNYSRSETGRALLTSDEIKRLGDKEIIVASGTPPVLTEKVKYFENDYFRKKLIQAPVVSDIIRPNKYKLRDKLLQAAAKPKPRPEFDFKWKSEERKDET